MITNFMWYTQTKKSILTGVCTLVVFSSYAQSSATFAQKLFQAFQQKDTTFLTGELASNFSIAGHTDAGAKFRLDQIVKNYQISKIDIKADRKVKRGHVMQLAILDKVNKSINAEALFDTTDKLVHLSLFDQLYGMQRMDSAKLRAVIPFENHNGSIYLQVKINGYDKPLRLLFDTGADGMAVSQQLADRIGLKITREKNASVVGGHAKIQISENNTVGLDTLNIEKQSIAIFPEMGRDGDGIIGNTIIRRYITHIDYDNNLLSLYEFGGFQYSGQGTLVPISMPSGVMVLPGQLDITKGKSYAGRFVFDTGASYDLICFRPFVRQNKLLVSGFKPEAQAATVSMGISSPTFLGKSHQFAISPLPPMAGLPITLMGGTADNEQWQPGVDGSIGIRLLSRYNMTINLAESEVFFAPNKLHALPQDFLIRNHQFGWDNTGLLKALGSVGTPPNESPLKNGDLIQQIDGYYVDQLEKNPRLIGQIWLKAKENEITIMLKDNTQITL
ncbi:clan AA aspartic protease [Sphingobacterium puteale]|uniref:Clan AA aspartic protease n=1 Tax=Sphingobacterium puteale TaxID=2420510 RepID=A0A420VY90_9SPHI|nr:retropepsin-like aspartic protease [Sphingobacterium puteale]RKO71314.1 clan AA aspartic protease [Sphingobacterium puteale]